jgi:hypothetical protein
MDTFINAPLESLHHAYFIVGNEESLGKLNTFLSEQLGVATSGNPDYFHQRFDTLKIEDARDLAFAQERKDFSGNKKFFVIETDFITEEAQNSLLKVFEEPTVGTHFFIISPQEIILPTLKSRMLIIHDLIEAENEDSILKMSLAERIARVKEITESISDEDGTKQDAITFLTQIESELYKKGIEKHSRELKACEFSRQALYDRGAPVKIILEQLVLSI